MDDVDRRITRLEERVAQLVVQTKDNGSKLDSLIAAANMGRGAWWLILRMGTVMVAIAAVVAWVVDRIHWTKLP